MTNEKAFGTSLPMAAMVAMLTIALPSCTGGGNMFGGDYAIASDDACAQQRQGLKAFHDYFFSSMVEGAALGGVAGGLAGFAIGGNAQGALIGAGTGAVLGGLGGYYAAKKKANSEPGGLTNSVYQDVNQENTKIDGVSGAFLQLRDCRLHSATAVKSDYQAKKISREDAQAKLLKTKQLFLEDVAYAEGLGSKMAARSSEYDNASNQIMQADPGARQTLAARGAASGAQGGGGGTLVADTAARVRAEPTTTGAQVASLTPGESVTPVTGGNAPADWTQIQLRDGKTGYVASRLLRPAGTASARASVPPPHDAAGVAQLTESNQLKRKALDDEVAQAKADANGSTFELSGSISRAPDTLDSRASG